MKLQILAPLFAAALIGAGITFFGVSMFGTSEMAATDDTSADGKPIYWVAPMDANYRKDKPGKSPMGMDLVPVYEDGGSGMSPGTVKISPLVVNNLGVRTATTRLTPLQRRISTVGYVQYDADQLIHIHPRIEGWVEKLYVKAAGDPVKEGQPLYEIYSPSLVNAQEELLLALERKNTRLIRAAEDRLKALQIPAKAIQALKKNRSVQQRVVFYAPQSGVIDNLNIREGFFVKPTKALMSIGKLDQVWVEAEVFERQAQDVAIDLPVTMTLAYLPGRQWSGKVDYVYPTLNAETRTIKVRLRFENQDGMLKPNMFAQVIIHGKATADTLLIPREAVIRTGSQERVVLALGEGQFKSVHVRVGRTDNDSAEILEGLLVGDRVVSSAQFLLDSESNKSSDFIRMSANSESSANSGIKNDMSIDMSGMDMSYQAPLDNTATVTGKINNIMIDHRMLNISRGPIEKWGRAKATLNFTVSENITWPSLKVDQVIKFTFEIKDGEFVIIDIQPSTDSSKG